MDSICAHPGDIEGLAELLSRHPHVSLGARTNGAALTLEQAGDLRNVYVDQTGVELNGLVELIDNNPLVCASEFSLPSPEGTLALIALGPLIKAGILLEPPAGLFSFPAQADRVNRALLEAGWPGGAVCDCAADDFGPVLSGVFVAVIQSPEAETDIDAVYEDVFGRAFFIQRDEVSDWTPTLVEGKPFAKFSLRFAPDVSQSLLTIRVLADRRGKCGAAQIVHAMNVMCGFEESLGTC